jgi:hypothetical protein
MPIPSRGKPLQRSILEKGLVENVLECVEKGLAAFGEDAEHTVYWHLEQEKHTPRAEAVFHPNYLHRALKAVFGEEAQVLEESIVGEMTQRFKIQLDGLSFAQAMAAARASYSIVQEISTASSKPSASMS